MYLQKKDLVQIVEDNKFPLSREEFKNIEPDEKEIILRCAREFGFEVKDNAKHQKTDDKTNKFLDKPNAILIIRGGYGVEESHRLQTETGKILVKLMVIQQTRRYNRLKTIAKKLVEEKLAELYQGLDDFYLYHVLCETADDLFFENLKKIAKGIPIFEVDFDERGDFEIKEVGKIG